MILRRVRRGWLRRAVELLRLSRAVAYLLIACAGPVAIYWPPQAISTATGTLRSVAYGWAALMAVAALFCAYGAITGRWVGEYIGLVPLSLVAAAFGISALSRGPVSSAAGLFLLGFFWLLVARWQEVALIRLEATRAGRERNGAA